MPGIHNLGEIKQSIGANRAHIVRISDRAAPKTGASISMPAFRFPVMRVPSWMVVIEEAINRLESLYCRHSHKAIKLLVWV